MTHTESTKAFCYLEAANDEQNKILLKDNHLVVIQGGKEHKHDLLQIKKLSFKERKPMLYVLAGGIIVPFTSVAFYRNFLDPFPALFLLVLGIFCLYYGWMGYQVLVINEFTHHRDYKLKSVSTNLKEFVSFTRRHLPVNSTLDLQHEKMIYHITSIKAWKQQADTNQYKPLSNEPFIHASSYHQISGTLNKYFRNKKDLLLLTIDPLQVRPEIKYEDLRGGGQLYPHIYGPLNMDAIVKIEEISPP